jgi:hypothetical protein
MIERGSASKWNPIISPISVRETLQNVCDALSDLALIPDSAEHAGVTIIRFDFMALAVRAAVAFELGAMSRESEAIP